MIGDKKPLVAGLVLLVIGAVILGFGIWKLLEVIGSIS